MLLFNTNTYLLLSVLGDTSLAKPFETYLQIETRKSFIQFLKYDFENEKKISLLSTIATCAIDWVLYYENPAMLKYDALKHCVLLNLKNNKIMKPKTPVNIKTKRKKAKWKFNFNDTIISVLLFLSFQSIHTWVLSSRARTMANIWLMTPPSLGPANTTRYVMPNNGIKTNKALAALRYCRVSTVLAERNFVINTFKEYTQPLIN